MKNYLILKKFCRKIFLVGSGNFWYEEKVVGDDNSFFYKLFQYTLILTLGFMTLLEIIAALIGEFPEDEKRDSITFAVSHIIVMIKIMSVMSKKKLVKKLIPDLIKVCELYEEDSLMVEKYRIMKINIIAYIAFVFGCATCYVFEGIRKMYDGSHFVTIVTYYPSFGDDSLLAGITRIATTVLFFIMLLTMVTSVDCFALANLIIFKYKFITLQVYFERLREDFDLKLLETGNPTIAAERLTRGLIEGVVMHKELIRISKEIDKAFGTILTLQLCQSSGPAVSLLLQIATLSDQLSFAARMKILFFIIALFFLLGLFLCNAGDISYQAFLLSDSIFYCGWHACPSQYPSKARRNLGKLVLQACAQSQRPIVMKAFKMLDLTYGTFLLVVRGTYSVFALIYARNQKIT